MFPWSGTPEERMVSEIEDELAVYRKRCEALHEEFLQKLRTRDEARAALSEAEERISSVRMEGVALLGNLNAAMSEGDEDQIKDLERGYKRNNRDLVRTQKTRDAAARKLEAVEIDDERAVSELKNDVSNVLDEYAERVRERKQRLHGFMERLDKNREALARDTAPLTGEYKPRRQPEELPAAENSQED
ncbi:MAG: hypothetical protein WA982_01270 [Rubrobacteraceae bacterium]